jgi:hypothetical protein
MYTLGAALILIYLIHPTLKFFDTDLTRIRKIADCHNDASKSLISTIYRWVSSCTVIGDILYRYGIKLNITL